MRVAIIGAGLMGRRHAHAAVRAGGRVAAIVDPNRGRVEDLASRHPGSRVFVNVSDSLELADILHICTPTRTHVSLALQTLAARRHALVEKPLAPTAAETAELFRVAERQGVLLCPVHQFLFQTGVKAALSSPAIRPLRHVDITMCSAGGAGSDDAARDEIMLEILPHPLSLLSRLLPATLHGVEWSIRRPMPGELRAIAQADEVTVSLLISMGGRPTINRMQLTGAGATMHVDLFHGFAVTLAGTTSRHRKIAQPFLHGGLLIDAAMANMGRRMWMREFAYPGLLTLVERFYTAARTGDSCPISANETLDVAVTHDRLRAAAAPSDRESRPRPREDFSPRH